MELYFHRRDFVMDLCWRIVTKRIDSLSISVGGIHDFNLAYVPKNRDFMTVEGVQFNRAKDIKNMFLGLGYGEQMSDLLFSKAASMLLQEKTVSPTYVQRNLIFDWKDASDRSLIPLTFQKRKLFGRNGDVFLVLNSGVLMLARSKYNLARNLTLGLRRNFAQASLGAEKTPKGISTETKVISVYDPVCHLLGKQLNFRKEGTDWYKPAKEGMSSNTGVLTFLHVMLTGKVDPCGMFKQVVPAWHLSNRILQLVCFDLPIPYGITYSTHAMGFEPSLEGPFAKFHHAFFRVRQD